MTQQTMITTPQAPVTCDPRAAATRSLLGYGVIAGPVYVTVALVQALTRDGFDLTRHVWSMLANGDLGWIQIGNFAIAALATLACAAGLRRALIPGYGAAWAPRLVGVYGVSLAGAGIFRADPGLGFPAGTPDGPGAVSWHGMLHFACGAVGFLCLVAACFVVGRRFAAVGRTGWAGYSWATGALFLTSFVGVAAGGGAPWANLGLTAGIVLAWSWLSALSLHLYRSTVPARS
ncbi:DUF998 domain-containing protein [Streptosporangium sandarakinum]|uniref:DUF998 domain-containing protein n=1 Tax=Streptosporangium sandarakinum TaxID=1260955 RepID=UPI0034314347